MQEFEIHSINNQSIILPQTKNNFAIVFSSSQKYLITNCNNYFIKAFEHGFFLINKFSGIVYFYGHKNTINDYNSFNIIFNNTIHLLNFTKNDPIKNIFTKLPGFFAMLSKNNNVYLFSTLSNYKGLVPKEKFENEKVVQIACGGVHVLFLTENNNLFGAGNSFDGSLSIDNVYGLNTDIVKCDTSMIGNQKIKEIDVSYNCSFILTFDGDLFATGSCTFGVSGQPQDIRSCKKFTKIKSNVEKVIAGYFFVALKTFENEYFIFGYNNCNQFGEVDSSLMENDKIYGTNTKLTSFNIHDIDQLQCGGYHSMIVNKNQDIYISGNGFDNSIINGNHKVYTKIEMTKVIKNWENCKRDFNFKLETGYDFILIYSERKRNYFNFTNAYKIADITFNFSN